MYVRVYVCVRMCYVSQILAKRINEKKNIWIEDEYDESI